METRRFRQWDVFMFPSIAHSVEKKNVEPRTKTRLKTCGYHDKETAPP
jgi:hypothetical protein